jgi:hypothetical protein
MFIQSCFQVSPGIALLLLFIFITVAPGLEQGDSGLAALLLTHF